MKILKGNLVSAPALGKLEIVEHGCLVLHDDGSIQSVEKAVPQNADAEVIDYGDSLIMPSFVDMHLHAPQYPMRHGHGPAADRLAQHLHVQDRGAL